MFSFFEKEARPKQRNEICQKITGKPKEKGARIEGKESKLLLKTSALRFQVLPDIRKKVTRDGSEKRSSMKDRNKERDQDKATHSHHDHDQINCRCEDIRTDPRLKTKVSWLISKFFCLRFVRFNNYNIFVRLYPY